MREGSQVSDQECCKSHGVAVTFWHQTKEIMKYFLRSFLPSMSYFDHNILRVSGKKKIYNNVNNIAVHDLYFICAPLSPQGLTIFRASHQRL